VIRRFAVAMVLALVPMAVVAPAASAGSSEWCDVDPLVVIKTPKGNLVPVFNTNGARGLQYQPLLLLAKVKYTVQPADGGRKTLVKMEVTVPEGLFLSNFATRTIISTGPLGTLSVLAATEGRSGRPMPVQFTLDVP
jgi:hypothetical protein